MPQGRQYGLFLCFWVQGWFPCGRKEGVVMLTCGDLKNLPVLQKIKYLTGDSGLANPIRWTFVPETEKLEPWIHGGELLLLSGALSQRRDFRLGQVLLDAMRLKMAGAVLLVGDSYIQKVPREAIARAIEQDFAIMAIPWNVPLVDIQEAVARAIVMSDTQLTLDNALDFLLQGRISAREYAGFVLAPFFGTGGKDLPGAFGDIGVVFCLQWQYHQGCRAAFCASQYRQIPPGAGGGHPGLLALRCRCQAEGAAGTVYPQPGAG